MTWLISAGDLQIIGEIALAMLLGGFVGLERETANKPAGFRTHMLVSGAAAFLVALGFLLVERFLTRTADAAIAADPIRIVQAVIIGVSFLGTGTIFRTGRGDQVHGLTTAASLLMSSAIGVAVSLHEFAVAVGVTLLVTVVLRAVGWIESRLHRR